MSEKPTPAAVYKSIIDEIVNKTRRYGCSSHVREDGIYSKAPDHQPFNEFIATLSQEQREVLANMLQEEYEGAIHNVLAALSWQIDCNEVGLTYDGKPMPVDISGMGLHGDFVGRRDGWDWPED